MALNRINLYDNIIKFPSDEDVKKMGNKLCHLVYFTPYASSIIEYAGRTCYRSFNNIQEESYKKFIASVVGRGHESVIEHSNLVYVVFKKYHAELKRDSDNINRYLINLMMYNGLLRVSENQGYYLISGNLRMFKDLIREYYRIKEKSGKVNPILDNIRDSFYSLPQYYFGDMIQNKILNEKNFKLDPRIKEAASSLNLKSLSPYLSILNHDNFTFKVRGFSTIVDGVSTIRRLVTPINILRKHNRITLLITAPRYITHQLVRHRMASYSQASQRYILEEGNNVYMPPGIKEHGVEALADNCFKNCFNVYTALIDAGVNKEDARAVLPNAFMSTIVMTIAIDKLDNFLALRCDKAAQAFIRDEIAIPLRDYIEGYYRRSEEGEETLPPFKANSVMIPVPKEAKKTAPKKNTSNETEHQKKNYRNKPKEQNKQQPSQNKKGSVNHHNSNGNKKGNKPFNSKQNNNKNRNFKKK